MKIQSFLFLMLPFVFCRCATSIPCEKKVIERNLFEEYFSIAENYKSLENYSKAIEYYKKTLPSDSLHDYAFYEIALCNIYLKIRTRIIQSRLMILWDIWKSVESQQNAAPSRPRSGLDTLK